MVGSIEKAGNGFSLLQKHHKHLRFVSNNSLRTDDEFIAKLNNIGVKDVIADDLIHPDKTILDYIRSNPKYKKITVLGCQLLKNTLEKEGYEVEKFVSIGKTYSKSWSF